MAGGKTEFLRDPKTGVLYAYRDGELVGPMLSFGEPLDVPPEPSEDLWEKAHGM